MKLILRILPLLALLTLITALATRSSHPFAWAATPVEVGEPSSLPPLLDALDTVELAGLVRGPSGQPLAEAVVLLDAREPRWAYTDSGGRFRIDRVPLGPQRVSVWARKHESQEFEVFAPAGDLDLTLDTSLTELPQFPTLETQELSGEVVPSIVGRGLAGFEILLLPAKPVSRFGEPVPRRTTVGADRSFRFTDLILGEYRVVVLPPWSSGGDWPNLCAPQSRRLVHTRASSTSGLRVELSGGEIRGTITDPKGRFLEGAMCLLSVDALPERVWPAVETAADGSFLISDLPPEIYRLEVRAGSGALSIAVEVPPGATVEAELPPIDPGTR